ncbi:hypothetical protein V1527DRAFT_472840 [Lipomyces starkeyi]
MHRQLFLHAYKAYLKEHGTEREKQQQVVLTDWMKLFGPPPEFWKLKQEEAGVAGETTCRVRLRNKFMTDGISLSDRDHCGSEEAAPETKNENEIRSHPCQDTHAIR